VPPQVVPAPVQAVRDPVGAPVVAAHVPTEPATLHASHCPPQPVSQHTPSTQFPDTHWLAAAHATPLPFFGTHAPALQKSPAMQSASLAHVTRHALEPQTKGEHDVVTGAGQDPAPLQPAAATARPEVHDAERQLVELVAYVHAVRSVPSQLPPHTEPSLAHAVRGEMGAPDTAVHVPTVPVRLHASHCPPQAELQHTPSAQLADEHSFAAVHVAPFAFFAVHVPALQKSPETQSLSAVQALRHAVVPQTYGAHDVVTAVGHVPAPSQPAATVATPPVQLAERQLVEAPGYVHAVRDAPSHEPPHEVPVPVHAVRPPTGAPVTALHVPTEPVALHVSHCPAQAESQQTPSAHCAELHSLDAPHVAPFGFPPPPASVVAVVDGPVTDQRPAASPASTLNVYDVEAVRPLTA